MVIPTDSWERHKWIYRHMWVWKEANFERGVKIWKEWSWAITFLKLFTVFVVCLILVIYSFYIAFEKDLTVPFLSGAFLFIPLVLSGLGSIDTFNTIFWFRGSASFSDASMFEVFIAKLVGKYFDEKEFVDSLTRQR